MRKPRSDSLYARLKTKGLSESQATLRRKELFERMDGGEAIDSIVKQCAAWGVKTSHASVSEFYQWHLLDLQTELAEAAARPARESGTFEKEASIALAQKRYVEIMKSDLDPKLLIALSAIEEKAKQREFDREKFKASLRTKLETAMDALKAEIQSKPKALAAFEQMQEALTAK